jgi:hypothetical protein
MKRDLEISIQAEEEHRDTDGEYYKKWHDKHVAAWEEVRKQHDIGSFLFSRETMRIVEELCSRPSNRDSYFENLVELNGQVSECLPALDLRHAVIFNSHLSEWPFHPCTDGALPRRKCSRVEPKQSYGFILTKSRLQKIRPGTGSWKP